MEGGTGGVPLGRRGEGCSTKSPSPQHIPNKGTKIKPRRLYIVGALLKYGLLADGAVLQSTIQATSGGEPGGGGGQAGFSNQGRWAEAKNTSKWAHSLGEAKLRGAFLSAENPY